MHPISGSGHLIERLANVAAVESISTEWSGLFSRIPNAHWALDYAMVLGNAAARRQGSDWSIYLARQQGDLVGGLFGYRRTHTFGLFEIPVFRVGTEYVGDFLVADDQSPDALASLLQQLITDCKDVAFLEFGGIRKGPLQQLLAAAARVGLKVSVASDFATYSFDVSKGVDPVLARMGPQYRRKLRRGRKRLEAQHRVELDCVNPSDAVTNSILLEQFIDIERRGWKGRAGSSIGDSPSEREYYETVTSLETARRAMWWFTLRADGQPAAMYMCMKARDCMVAPKTAYDERYAAYSPGNDLLLRVIEWLAEQSGIKTLNTLTGAEWLRHWHPNKEPRFRARIFMPTVSGWFFEQAERLLRGLKQKRP